MRLPTEQSTRNVSWCAWAEPSQLEFLADVVHADGEVVDLSHTFFEPDSTVVAGDRGTITCRNQSRSVVRVHPDGGHILSVPLTLERGTEVQLEIDSTRRAQRRRTCALQNLLLSVLSQQGKWTPVSRSHRSAIVRSDGWSSSRPNLQDLSAEIARLIEENHPIWTVPDPALSRRFWQVDGVGLIEEPFLSVESTGQVGEFKLRNQKVGGRFGIVATAIGK